MSPLTGLVERKNLFEAGTATPVRQLTDCGLFGSFAVGFRACGAWAKTQKRRRSGERDLRYPLWSAVQWRTVYSRKTSQAHSCDGGKGSYCRGENRVWRSEVAPAFTPARRPRGYRDINPRSAGPGLLRDDPHSCPE